MNNDHDKEDLAQAALKRLDDSDDLLSILIDIENYFDTNNLYAFKNWIKGEVIGGPYVKKYWIKVILKYPYHDMPDPDGAARLLKHGTKCHFDINIEKFPLPIKKPSDYLPGTKKPRIGKRKVWEITFLIPRKFVQNLSAEIMDQYQEEVDLDTVDDAQGEGATPEAAVGAQNAE